MDNPALGLGGCKGGALASIWLWIWSGGYSALPYFQTKCGSLVVLTCHSPLVFLVNHIWLKRIAMYFCQARVQMVFDLVMDLIGKWVTIIFMIGEIFPGRY